MTEPGNGKRSSIEMDKIRPRTSAMKRGQGGGYLIVTD